MSLIIHRCSTCGHADIFHNSNQCCAGHCSSGVHVPRYGEPELIPTRSQETGELVEEIAEPGSKSTSFGVLPLELCGCDACTALYRELTGTAA